MSRRLTKFAVVMVLGLSLCHPLSALATTVQLVEESSPQDITDAMANKMVRGMANILTGWMELPKQVYETYKEEGLGMSMTVGPVKGIGMMLVRTVAGVGETATFFSPYPGFYDPYFEPEYVWQRE